MEVRLQGIAGTREVFLNGKRLDPKPSQEIWNHSPDGFNWGYSGSGPAQLGLAILLACLPREKALARYQDFKSKVIAALPMDRNFDQIVEIPND